MKKYNKVLHGPAEILIDPASGKEVVGSRILGVQEALTKQSIKELNDRYGVLYDSAIYIIQALDPITTISVFHILCLYTQISTNRLLYEPKDIIGKTGLGKSSYYRSMTKLKQTNIIMDVDGVEYMNPLVFSRMAKAERIAFYTMNDCTITVGPDDFRKNLL